MSQQMLHGKDPSLLESFSYQAYAQILRLFGGNDWAKNSWLERKTTDIANQKQTKNKKVGQMNTEL